MTPTRVIHTARLQSLRACAGAYSALFEVPQDRYLSLQPRDALDTDAITITIGGINKTDAVVLSMFSADWFTVTVERGGPPIEPGSLYSRVEVANNDVVLLTLEPVSFQA
jgi:hypothetical protein